ncbi:MAG: hypothetical protein AB7S92_19690 [Parvibaculaceae bacterium]
MSGSVGFGWVAATIVVKPSSLISAAASVTGEDGTVSAGGAVALAGTAALTGIGDTVSAAATAALAGTAAMAEADHALAATGVLAIAGAAGMIEAGDAVSAAVAANGAVGALAAAAADQAVAAAGAVPVAGTLATTAATGLAAEGAVAIRGEALIALGDAAAAAPARMPVVYPRRGGIDEREELRRRELEWERDLRRIIEEAWAVAHGLVDPVTLAPVPPPDFDGLAGALASARQAVDRESLEALLADVARREEEEAMVILLAA